MKTIISCLAILILIQVPSISQETNTKVKEIGINLGGSNCGIRFKTGNQSSLLRITLLSISGYSSWQNNSSGSSNNNNSQGVGFNIGMEKRKNIAEGVSFYYGLDLLTSYYRSIYKYNSSSPVTDKDWTFSPGLGFIIGFNYSPIPKIIVSAELMPSISYNYSKHIYDDQGGIIKYSSSSLDYGLRNNGINLTLAYVFGK
jgi:hypothetical protein